MASLVLSSAGAAIGGAVFGPIGAIAGRIVGAVAGSVIDHALFGSSTTRHVDGPRLSDLDVMASTEGAPIPRVYGRARLAGQVIWATSLEEVVTTRTADGGGKGGSGGGTTTTTTVYSYFANFAVGLCEGQIGRVARVWADGKLLDLNGINHRVFTAGELDRALTEAIYDPAYLAGNLRGGEAYDWYYADGTPHASRRRVARLPMGSASRGRSAPRISGTGGQACTLSAWRRRAWRFADSLDTCRASQSG